MRPVLILIQYRGLLRYAAVGVANAAVYYLVYLGLHGTLGYLAAHLAALGVAMVASFFLNCRFTFRVAPTRRRFALFPLSQAVNLLATTVGLIALVALGVDERVAPLAAAVAAVPVSFLAVRLVLVRPAALVAAGPAAAAPPAVPGAGIPACDAAPVR